MSKTVEQLAETAWSLVEDALTLGKITMDVNGTDPQEMKLSADQIIDLAVKIAQVKIKKPQAITTPEDFMLQETIADDDG